MSASTILNLFACGVLSDQELIEAYEDVVERMVIYGDTIAQAAEVIFLLLIERVIELKDTAKIEAPSTSAAHLNNSVGFGLTPSTSRNGDYDFLCHFFYYFIKLIKKVIRKDVIAQFTSGNNGRPTRISSFRKGLPQILAVMVKNVVLISYGLTVGYITILIPALSGKNDHDGFHLNEDQISWIGSINMMCVPLGCLVSGVATDPIGRKRSMQIINFPFIVCWVIFYFSNEVWHLYLALSMGGFFGGLVEAPILTYVSEITQPHLRGALAASSSLAVILGILIEFVLGTFLEWRTVALISCIFPVTSFCLLCFMPESPHWLIMNNKIDKARKSLAWLRGWTSLEEIEPEIQEICRSQKNLQVEEFNKKSAVHPCLGSRINSLKVYTKKKFLWPFGMVSLLYFLSHFTGSSTLQTYAVKLFQTLRSPIDVYYATIIMGVAELLGSIVSLFLVRFFGKRIMAFVSIVGVGLSDFIIGTYAYIMDIQTFVIHEEPVTNTSFDFDYYQWISLVALVFLAFMAHCGFRVLPWILIGEIYPHEIRATGCGLSGASSYVFSFASNKTFLRLTAFLTIPGIYWFYGSLSFVGLFCVYFILPETEGKTLEEITNHFAGKSKLGNKMTKNKLTHTEGNINIAYICTEQPSINQKQHCESRL
ncbi:hypothetical protein RN001_008726 [Aquatica leii]|uniref:Major facilitator superfamily (MFS) profile domain-containing protein n=1 Tax=Aquatica leii TaxID=1421715 RepID=A0AAN7Q5C6_9COLE|nr:hypothetical protein RN001_008726 [Aquatica leii]